MNALEHLLSKYHLDPNRRPLPLDVPDGRIPGLAQLFAELGYRVGAEIGVWKGQFSAHLCAANPGLKLTCVDPWQPYPDMPDPAAMEGYYQTALARLAPYGVTIVRQPSLAAVQAVPLGSLDFVYIDGDHRFEFVVNDIIQWAKRVRSGGIVSGHDYRFLPHQCPSHVVEAVNGWVRSERIVPWFRFRADKAPSWVVVKP